MPLVVRAFPVISDRNEVAKFVEELNERRASDVDAFYQRFGVSREAWFLQETPNGLLLIGLTEASDLNTAPLAYAAADEPFEAWFKQECLRLTGIDLNQMPLGPPSEKVFEWNDKDRLRSDAFHTQFK
jgi:hypothetical protein